MSRKNIIMCCNIHGSQGSIVARRAMYYDTRSPTAGPAVLQPSRMGPTAGATKHQNSTVHDVKLSRPRPLPERARRTSRSAHREWHIYMLRAARHMNAWRRCGVQRLSKLHTSRPWEAGPLGGTLGPHDLARQEDEHGCCHGGLFVVDGVQ